MPDAPRRRIHVLLEPLDDDVPVEVRLRRLLKIALRQLALRAVAVEESGEEPEAKEMKR